MSLTRHAHKSIQDATLREIKRASPSLIHEPARKLRQTPHTARPEHKARHPVHVTLRARLRSLRSQFVFPTLRHAMRQSCSSNFRVIHFSVEPNHVHLLVEAQDRSALVRGMRGLSIRIARAINTLLFRRGKFWADRWHGRDLTSPRAVRNALRYVLHNFKKHLPGARGIDPYSSAPAFFRQQQRRRDSFTRSSADPLEFPEPRTWLLHTGWRRHGAIAADEAPVPRG